MRDFILFFLIILCSCSGSSSLESEVEDIAYSELHRPQFHFTPKANWMNDPNGMFYLDGEYHLFYQYYPDSNVWGPMHWGHAISKDLVHWEHMPIALYPDSLGYIFSGSAVVDWENTSGLGREDNPPVVAIFTYHDPEGDKRGEATFQYQGIAYSLDKGRTWEKYSGNPVLENPGIRDFRDPKVFWHKESGKWIMSLAVQDHIQFYSSPDLKQWQYESEFGKELGPENVLWECPDLFPIKVVEKRDSTTLDTLDTKYVLLVSNNPGGPNGGSTTQYFVGDFDGKEFKVAEGFLDNGPVWLDYGRDNYAGVTWSDIPEEDGRRIFIGWMSNWDYAQVVPTEVWRSAMTFPRELELRKVNDTYFLRQLPIRPNALDRSDVKALKPYSISGEFDLSAELDFRASSYDLNLHMIPQEPFSLVFYNDLGEKVIVKFDTKNRNILLDRDGSGDLSFSSKFGGIQEAPLTLPVETHHIRILMDHSSMELFSGYGEIALTSQHFPSQPLDRINIITEGLTYFDKISIAEINSIWNQEATNNQKTNE